MGGQIRKQFQALNLKRDKMIMCKLYVWLKIFHDEQFGNIKRQDVSGMKKKSGSGLIKKKT